MQEAAQWRRALTPQLLFTYMRISSRSCHLLRLALACLPAFTFWSVSAGAELNPGDAGKKPAEKAAVISDQELYPVIHEWQREGYNFWFELKTTLQQGAYDDAAALVFQASFDLDRGLLADFQDTALLVPCSTMIARVMQDYPPATN